MGARNQAGSVADKGVGSLAPGTAHGSRNRKHVAAEFQGVLDGDQSAALPGSLYDHHRLRETGDQPVAPGEVVR